MGPQYVNTYLNNAVKTKKHKNVQKYQSCSSTARPTKFGKLDSAVYIIRETFQNSAYLPIDF